MGRKHEMDLECWHVYYYMGKLISTNGNMMNPWFRKHVNCCICQQPIHDAVFFIKYFKGGITKKPINWNTIWIQCVFGTTWWGRDWAKGYHKWKTNRFEYGMN